MDIIIIVNIICSLGIVLGGLSMKKCSKSYEDFSIGFKTNRSMSSKEAWNFANQKCGGLWVIIGLVSFVLTIFAVFIKNEKTESIVQTVLLVLQTIAVSLSIIAVELQLKRKYDNN